MAIAQEWVYNSWEGGIIEVVSTVGWEASIWYLMLISPPRDGLSSQHREGEGRGGSHLAGARACVVCIPYRHQPQPNPLDVRATRREAETERWEMNPLPPTQLRRTTALSSPTTHQPAHPRVQTEACVRGLCVCEAGTGACSWWRG